MQPAALRWFTPSANQHPTRVAAVAAAAAAEGKDLNGRAAEILAREKALHWRSRVGQSPGRGGVAVAAASANEAPSCEGELGAEVATALSRVAASLRAEHSTGAAAISSPDGGTTSAGSWLAARRALNTSESQAKPFTGRAGAQYAKTVGYTTTTHGSREASDSQRGRSPGHRRPSPLGRRPAESVGDAVESAVERSEGARGGSAGVLEAARADEAVLPSVGESSEQRFERVARWQRPSR